MIVNINNKICDDKLNEEYWYVCNPQVNTHVELINQQSTKAICRSSIFQMIKLHRSVLRKKILR